MRRAIWVMASIVLLPLTVRAELQYGFFDPYKAVGSPVSFETLSPAVRKWYLPQTLQYLYGWKNHQSTNYARDNYQRYTDIFLEGDRFYDLYGNFITRGWRIYDWRQEQPLDFGSSILKSSRFASFFSRLLISSANKGQFHTSLVVGETIRTTLTPLTFSKPVFDGIQWDMQSDKYAFTIIASRIDNPATSFGTNEFDASKETIFTNMMGGRGVMQMGDFATLGLTYVNASHWNSRLSLEDNSFKGVLGGRLNADNVRRIVVRLSDDSPEDSEGGALLFRERIFVDGVEHAEIRPTIDGGIRRQGLLEANGPDVITLSYDIERDFVAGVRDSVADFKEARKIEIEMVVANDYRIDVTSNMQTNATGETVFLLVERSNDNIKDGSNQKVVRFKYGLPTSNEIFGFTFDIADLAGFNLRSEFDVNRRHRRFPNQNILRNQSLATDRASAFYVTASRLTYPFFWYGEAFSMDPDYSTTFVIPDSRGFIDYENENTFVYEFVDDNDDQDRFPDWQRRVTGGSRGSSGRQTVGSADREVFPGLDENNDLVNDFNQNDNLQPDYLEPFLRYNVDPPEYLFGTDMNNNGTNDRFENDTEADFPYKRDHRGYNLYGGAEIQPGSKLMLGRMRQWRLSSDRRSVSSYALFTWTGDMPRSGLNVRFLEFVRLVKDDIPDDLIQWVQPPFSSGGLQDVPDRLIALNTTINTTYLDFKLAKFDPLNIAGKVKWDQYFQRGDQAEGKRDESFFGLVLKADYPIQLTDNLRLTPRWKQLLTRRTPTDQLQLKTNDLSEIFFLMANYDVIPGKLFWESGVEWELFNNLRDKPDPAPPAFVEDFNTLTLASQFTNISDYQGYRMTNKLGVRWQRRDLDEGSETNFLAFLTVYAGLQ
ncbi:MAG: hypothetical protein GKR89_24650 [Candidatus Latescibacteria bacterium]|nr:hypothetical protein [Candidatus Latescibacterota bacterium]